MASIPKTRVQAINTADAFRARFGSDSIYAFIARITPYNSSSSSSPGTSETEKESINIWDGIYALKKLTLADVSHVVPVNDWVTSTTYDMYEHDIEIASADSTLSYFVSEPDGSNLNIYKCINNGSFGECDGSASTVSPVTASGTSTTVPDNASDNYRWKFMYQITDYADNKFYDTSWIPVSRSANAASLQGAVAAAASDGAIDHIKVTNVGSGYTSPPTVTITGDGSGAEAIAIVKGLTASSSSAMGSSSSSGFECEDTSSSSSSSATLSSSSSSSAAPCTELDNTIIEIIMINRGSGYTNATVSLTGGGGSGAQAKAIISPKWGHGYDPVKELAANSVMVVGEFNGDEGNTISVSNDYYQFGLIVNPTLYNTKNVATGNVYSQVLTLNMNDSSATAFSGGFTPGSLITGDTSGATALVLEWNPLTASTGNLLLIHVDGTFVSGESINSTPAHTINTITNPPLEPGSGEIILTDNTIGVSRDELQRDRIRMVFTF